MRSRIFRLLGSGSQSRQGGGVVAPRQQGGQIGGPIAEQQFAVGRRQAGGLAAARKGRAAPALRRGQPEGRVQNLLLGGAAQSSGAVMALIHRLRAPSPIDIARPPLLSRRASPRRLPLGATHYFVRHAARLASGPYEGESPLVQIFVRDNNVDQALKALKKKMQREGSFREMKRHVALREAFGKARPSKGRSGPPRPQAGPQARPA
jgi:hypothetical protein